MVRVPEPYSKLRMPDVLFERNYGATNDTRSTIRLLLYPEEAHTSLRENVCLQNEDNTAGGETWMTKTELLGTIIDLIGVYSDLLGEGDV